MNWQEENAKAEMLGATAAGIGCLLPALLLVGALFIVAMIG